jgi:hypothetical protein
MKTIGITSIFSYLNRICTGSTILVSVGSSEWTQ